MNKMVAVAVIKCKQCRKRITVKDNDRFGGACLQCYFNFNMR